MKTEVYSIPKINLPVLEAKIAKINKRATKLDASPLVIEIIEEYFADYGKDTKYEALKVQVVGCEPKLAGWTFLGTLDHFSLPGQVIIKTVPGKTIPESVFDDITHETKQKDALRYELARTDKGERITKIQNKLAVNPMCDHCHTRRRRTETFVVQHENGNYKQVGRNCLKDFLGHSPTAILNYLSAVWHLFDDLDDEESSYRKFNGGYRSPVLYPLQKALEITAAEIRRHGWVSRREAMNDETKRATADDVESIMTNPRNAWHTDPGITKDDIELVEKATAWVKELKDDGKTDYVHNIKQVVKTDHVSHSLFGIACSIIAAYHRATKKDEEKTTRTNEYVGSVGAKPEIVVKIRALSYHQGWNGGTCTLYKMEDTDGRSILWFSNAWKGIKMEEGKTYKIKGTVKKHDEYKGWKQTYLNRVKVLEEIKDTA